MLAKHRITEFSDRIFKTDNSSHCQNSLHSLPRNLVLRQSKHSNLYGIWSQEDIPMGTRFGPYELNKQVSKVMNRENLNFLSNWFQYIRSAHNEQQQNLFIFRCQGEIFCLSCVHIPANTELLICYNNERECALIGVANIKLYEVSYESMLGLQYGERHTEHDACVKTTWCSKQLNVMDLFYSNSNHKYNECREKSMQSTNSEILRQALSGEKFSKCDKCGEKFTRDVDLEIHKKGHIQKESYECKSSGITSKHNLKVLNDDVFRTSDGSYWQTSLHSLPENLSVRWSVHYSDFYGIWSQEDIPEGTRFGPYKEIQVVKITKRKMQYDILSSWFHYIRPAYREEQQNLVMYRCEGQIFCVSCFPIPANSELLFGYKEKVFPWICVVNSNIKLYEVSYKKILHNCKKFNECDECIETAWQIRELNVPDVFHCGNNDHNYKGDKTSRTRHRPTNPELWEAFLWKVLQMC